MILIGIAGGTGAGKSAIAQGLALRLGAGVLDLDSYYRDRGHLPPEERGLINYDEPDAIDAPLLVSHLQQLGRGTPIERPVYSFATHTRIGVEIVTPAPVVIVEGLFTLWWEEARPLFDVTIFVEASADLRLIRRIQRDTVERGRSVEHVLAQYLRTVRPMHERYVEPLRAHADLLVVNDESLADAIERIAGSLRLVTVGGSG
jgi:uridine kinase